jgi:chaperone required for assembly of F1-ATPase
MKASEVRILPALDPGDSYLDAAFMLVETALDDNAEPATTIEHFSSHVVGEKTRWQIATLGQSVPLSHAAALEWAVSFAASRNIPIVYERDDTLLPAHAAAPNAGAEAARSSASK